MTKTYEYNGEAVEFFLKNGPAILEPLSKVNNAYGFVTFKLRYDHTMYETTMYAPYLDLKEGQIQAAFDEDGDLVVTVSEEA